MKKIFNNRIFWIVLAVLAIVIIAFFALRKKTTSFGLVGKSPEEPRDQWAGLRESLGDWSQKADDDKVWTAAGDLFLSHVDNPAQRNSQVEPYWRAMYAWFKGYNIRPDGYQAIVNKPLRDAITAYVNANPGISQATISVGQFII